MDEKKIAGEIPLNQAQKLLELEHTMGVVLGIIRGASKTLVSLHDEKKALWAKITKERGLREEDEYGFTLPADVGVFLERRTQ